MNFPWSNFYKPILAASALVLLIGCSDSKPSASPESTDKKNASSESSVAQATTSLEDPEEIVPLTSVAAKPLSSAALQPPQIKNVILLIGDGMGPQQIGLLMSYAHLAPNSVVADRTPAIERMMQQGNVAVVRTDPHNAVVTDSAAAATQLSTGQPAGSEMIGLNYKGERADTVLEIAKANGKSTGLVSDTRITHATPAAFAAHQTHRTKENEIAEDLIANGVDVLLSGGMRNWLPQSVNNKDSAAYLAAIQMNSGQFDVSSKRKDNRNLLVEARSDYQLVFDRFALSKVKSGRVLGLFANSEMYDAMSERQTIASQERSQPTLVEMSTQAIEILEKNPQGFFLMIEGGQIDWAGHNNDTGTMLHELLRFDKVVNAVLEWAEGREDTIVLVTADHETGGFGFSYSGSPLPVPQTLPGKEFEGQEFKPYFNFGSPEVLDKIYAQEKSFYQIFSEFDALAKEEQTPENLLAIIQKGVAFELSLDDAIAILRRHRNSMYQENHKYLGSETFPQIEDFTEFYVYGENLRLNILARRLAAQQNVVWASGTHTSTPVLLISYGPPEITEKFTGMLHSTDVGKKMIELVQGK